MKPERARRLSRRWDLALLAGLLVYLPLRHVRFPLDFIPAVVVMVAARCSAYLDGWAKGYAARAGERD